MMSSALIALVCLGAGPMAPAAENGNPADNVDRQLFPKAYSILSSDRLMFPVDVGDWPLVIDSRRQLFVDDFMVSSMAGLEREWHAVTKHPGNPIMVGELPWEQHAIIPLQVRRDPHTGVFRMWYTTRLRYTEPGGTSVRFPTLYAESQDGLTWERPELGLLEYDGSTKNNFVIHGGSIRGLFEDPNAADPTKRYTALVLHEPEYVDREGYYLYTSPDGLRWAGGTRMVIPSLHGYVIPQSGIGDTSLFRHDPELDLYVCDAKFVLPGTFRCRGQCESPDLIHWTRPRFTLYPDEHDEPDSQIYGNISFVYESMWLGLCRLMHDDRVGWKQVEIEMSLSRDGYHWARPAARRTILPLGDAESWDPDYSDPVHSGPIRVGDELWFYYRGSRHRDRDAVDTDFLYWRMDLGLAKLRRDGFASLNAGDGPGTLITRPLTFPGKRLFVNADVAGNGWIKAVVLMPDAEPIPGYGAEDALPLEEDAVSAPLTWRNAQDIALPEDGHVRLKFELKNAKLYAFWIE